MIYSRVLGREDVLEQSSLPQLENVGGVSTWLEIS